MLPAFQNGGPSQQILDHLSSSLPPGLSLFAPGNLASPSCDLGLGSHPFGPCPFGRSGSRQQSRFEGRWQRLTPAALWPPGFLPPAPRPARAQPAGGWRVRTDGGPGASLSCHCVPKVHHTHTLVGTRVDSVCSSHTSCHGFSDPVLSARHQIRGQSS